MKKTSTILAILSLVAVMFVMTACTPSSSKEMKERYEKNDYTVTVIIAESDNNETINWSIVAKKNAESLSGIIDSAAKTVTATSYKSREDAQKAYAALDKIDSDKKFLKDTIVVYGFSAEAVKIAK